MSEQPDQFSQASQLPPPLPGPDAAARRAQDPIREGADASLGPARSVPKAVLIGLSATAISIAIPILILIVLAIVAQLMIAGH
jgi:uncharacterized membrane protein